MNLIDTSPIIDSDVGQSLVEMGKARDVALPVKLTINFIISQFFEFLIFHVLCIV